MGSSSSIRRRRPGGTLRALLAIVIALAVGLTGYASYADELFSRAVPGTPLLVYTYSSFLGGGCGSTPAADALLGAFDQAYGAHVILECPAGTLVSSLEAQRGGLLPDVVVGLDELTAPEAEARGLVVPYSPPSLSSVPTALLDEISPLHGVTPYEWGYLAFDYNVSFLTATRGAVANASFLDYAANSSWAKQLLIEDPTLDITGEEFLAWEVEFYTHVLHGDWTSFWKAVDPNVRVASDWGTAFTEFSTPPNNPGVVVSYSTDPAYASYYNVSGTFNSTVAHWNGSSYGWKTIYGAGIVSGSHHVVLAEQFVNWLLSGAVQSELPTAEWEYPAVSSIRLPSVYSAAIPPASIVPLNDATTPNEVANELPGWISTWQAIGSG